MPEPGTRPPHSHAPTTPTTILLVDDQRDALDMWAIYLRSKGYEVLTAGDGLTALTIASDRRPDVVVLDLDLPVVSGLEAARRLRGAPGTAGLGLIAVTGFSGAVMEHEAQHAGFDAVLVKPCEPGSLVGEVERVRHARRSDLGHA